MALIVIWVHKALIPVLFVCSARCVGIRRFESRIKDYAAPVSQRRVSHLPWLSGRNQDLGAEGPYKGEQGLAMP